MLSSTSYIHPIKFAKFTNAYAENREKKMLLEFENVGRHVAAMHKLNVFTRFPFKNGSFVLDKI